MAKSGFRNKVTKAFCFTPGRWRLTLECGHVVEITSSFEPKMGTCRECPKQAEFS